MKKVIFKGVIVALLTVFAVTFVGVQEAAAQATLISTSADLYGPAQGTFIGSDAAKNLLKAEIASIKGSGAAIGSAKHREGLYYHGIVQELDGGKSVSEAIGNGLGYLNDSNGNGDLSRTALNGLRQKAIDLLQ